MITAKEIRKSLKDLINSATGLPVFFNFVQDSKESYIYIRLVPSRRDEGFGYFVRKLRADIQVVLNPANGVVKAADLFDIADKLDAAFSGYIKVSNRFITIYDTSSRIFDSVLTYSFDMSFADFIDAEKPGKIQYEDLMKELIINY